MADQAIDVVLVGLGDAERRLEVFAGKGEAMPAVMRGADDDKEAGRGALEDFLERPGIAAAAPAIIDVRDQHGPKAVIGIRFAGQTRTTGPGKQLFDDGFQIAGMGFVLVHAAGLADRVAWRAPGNAALRGTVAYQGRWAMRSKTSSGIR